MPSPVSPDLRDHAAFSRAYAQHARAVHKAAMGVLNDHARAQDVVQDVFLRLWRRPVWRETQATRRMSDRLKVVAERIEEPAPDSRLGAERHDLRVALRGLPEGQREAVVLTYWGGLTAEEVARHADVPLGTAKSRVRLGVMRLRASYEAAA
jgi:RNA polymerase sigma-70 factor (ECF subfamily)